VNALLVGKIHSEENHPISRPLMRIYQPVVEFVLRHQWATIFAAFLVVAVTFAPRIGVFERIGSEFMPPLDEGTLLYMPSTVPGISVTEAQRVLQIQDKILKSFPEVERVFGKAGRAETATDPAPLSMMETVIVLRPQSEWPKIPTWYSDWAPEWLKNILSRAWPDHPSTQDLIYGPNGLDKAMQIPGVVNAWTMPIKARVDMNDTGVRTPVGIKILGHDLGKIQQIGLQIEAALKNISGTSSIYAERTTGGYFLDVDLKREELARYGLTVGQVESTITSAIGGENISTTVEGRERYPINIRYLRDYRSTVDRLNRTMIATDSGAQVPIAQLADIKLLSAPGMIRDDNARLSGYVSVNIAGRGVGSYVEQARQVVGTHVHLPPGYTLVWSGQYENMLRVRARLIIVVPITLLIVALLIYMNTRSAAKTLIIFLAVPFSAVGAIWLIYMLGYNFSIAVWVGLIALVGVDAETGVFMLLYLDLAYYSRRDKGLMKTKEDLRHAIVEGAVKRLRPKFMTVAVMFMGLLPIMWSTGAGSDVMKRIAAPMVGGIFTSFIMELLVYPAIYEVWRSKQLSVVSRQSSEKDFTTGD
jgi:copper/silver efflux system protein